ncbi:MAG: 3-hydroxyacyl-CoA dehydrogenase family protein [Chitinophagaceae bacterium]
MKIAAIGTPEKLEELNSILSTVELSYTRLESTKNIHTGGYDFVFDLNFDDCVAGIEDYLLLPESTFIFLSGVKVQIEAVLPKKLWKNVVLINAMRSFLKRSSIEYSTLSENFDSAFFLNMGWKDSNRVDSRLGMVSPRIICMIINEAFFTVQEGTANAEDINKGMKLGTAYPHGPFEWCDMIGIKDVYETLNALYNDTHDERYKICSSLKTTYLKSLSA